MVNVVIIIVFASLVLLLFWLKLRRTPIVPVNKVAEKYNLSAIEKFVKETLSDMVNADLYQLGLTEDEFHRQNRRRNELKEALMLCNTGDSRNKRYVVEFIYDLLQQTYDFNEERLHLVLPFDRPASLTARDKFDILLYVYKRKHGTRALATMLEEFNFAQLREEGSYYVSEQDVEQMFRKRVKKLSDEDKLFIITQRVYSSYKGFGVIDEIRDQEIDGISGGVNGLTSGSDDLAVVAQQMGRQVTSQLRSIWIMYKGRSIHLSFLEFAKVGELQRIINNMYKFNSPGQLSETRPYIISTMADGSRIVVMRPSMAESWAFFNRKPGVMNLSMDIIFDQQGGDMMKGLVKALMLGQQVTAITGQQGSGKTTFLILLIGYIRKTLNIRVVETAFEAHLRKMYPNRNILTMQETPHVTGQEGLDVSKKTDGDVNIIGEIATDQVAAWAVQTAQVASLFTLFSHHAMTAIELVDALRNSLLKTGIFSNEQSAERQVVSVLDFDIHFAKKQDGTRYIERISEIVPLDDYLPLPTFTEADTDMDRLVKSAALFYQQQLRTRTFEVRNIVEYEAGRYVPKCRISERRLQEMKQNMTEDERYDFELLLSQYWGDIQ